MVGYETSSKQGVLALCTSTNGNMKRPRGERLSYLRHMCVKSSEVYFCLQIWVSRVQQSILNSLEGGKSVYERKKTNVKTSHIGVEFRRCQEATWLPYPSPLLLLQSATA